MTKGIKALILTFLILIIVLGFFIVKNSKKEPPQISTKGPEYNGLTPGGSNKSDVTSKLGTPLKETLDGNNLTLEYKSQSNPNFNNEYLLRSDSLVFVKQYVTASDNIFITDIAKKYGTYEHVLYGNKSQNGFDLYVYPSKGIAYIGHQQAGIVLEIWYFQPTDLTNFVNNFAADYSETPESIQ